jgi:hypothetical protein
VSGPHPPDLSSALPLGRASTATHQVEGNNVNSDSRGSRTRQIARTTSFPVRASQAMRPPAPRPRSRAVHGAAPDQRAGGARRPLVTSLLSGPTSGRAGKQGGHRQGPQSSTDPPDGTGISSRSGVNGRRG